MVPTEREHGTRIVKHPAQQLPWDEGNPQVQWDREHRVMAPEESPPPCDTALYAAPPFIAHRKETLIFTPKIVTPDNEVVEQDATGSSPESETYVNSWRQFCRKIRRYIL